VAVPSASRVLITKTAITVGALGFLALHLLAPSVRVDPTAVGLMVLAALPWLSSVLKSAELPGLGKVEFHDLKQAGDKVTAEAPPENSSKPLPQPSYLAVAEHDPNLALAGLRIEIEKRLREMARRRGMPERRSVAALLGDFEVARIIDPVVGSGLRDLLDATNKAMHGASVEADASAWALTAGPKILAALDLHLQQ
jgi:hypothetical protein